MNALLILLPSISHLALAVLDYVLFNSVKKKTTKETAHLEMDPGEDLGTAVGYR